MSQSPDLSYKEVGSDLAIRICAHTEFANFQLEDWLAENLKIPAGGALLEIGCGDGNWFETWAKALGETGLIVGIDKAGEILAKAAAREIDCRRLLLKMDFNNLGLPPPVVRLRRRALFHLLRRGRAEDHGGDPRPLERGRVRLPARATEQNAGELYRLNERVFGFESADPTKVRAGRIEAEFLPAAEELFSEVSRERVPRRIAFPSLEKFIEYYRATLLFSESCKKSRPNAEPGGGRGDRLGRVDPLQGNRRGRGAPLTAAVQRRRRENRHRHESGNAPGHRPPSGRRDAGSGRHAAPPRR